MTNRFDLNLHDSISSAIIRAYDQLSSDEASNTEDGILRDKLRDIGTEVVISTINHARLSSGYQAMKVEETQTIAKMMTIFATFLVAVISILTTLWNSPTSNNDKVDDRSRLEQLE